MSKQKVSLAQTLIASSLRGALRLGFAPQILGFMSRQMNTPKRKKQAFASYVPNQHDIVVCTYAKSGTNWMLQIVTQIAYLGRGEFDHIHDLVPWPDPPMPGIVKLEEPTWEQAPTKLRALKTHWEAPYVPYNPHARYIIVIRDPKDALVSGYYFADSIFSGVTQNVTPETWTRLFIKGHSIFGSWPEHTASFWSWRERKNVLVLRFEDLKTDLEETVRHIAAFMEVPLTEVQLEEITRKSSFSYMKKIDHKFAPPSLASGRDTAVMLRSGKTGSAKSLLNAAQRQEVDEAMRRELEQLGSDFSYDQYGVQEGDLKRAEPRRGR